MGELIEIEAAKQAKSAPANPIALYPSDQTEKRIDRIIGTSPDFIFYALKAGHIRALFRHANVRTLLRGHTAQVLDIEYSGTKKGFGDDEARSSTMGLLSVGKDGQLIAWEIHVVHNADGTPELNPASLVQLVHPDRERLKDGAFFTAVRDSGSVAVALDAAGKVFFWEKSGGSKLMPLTSFPHPNGPVTSICISERNVIGTATDDGSISRWHIPRSPSDTSGCSAGGQWSSGHTSRIQTIWIDYSDSAEEVLTTTTDSEIKVWNGGGDCIQTLKLLGGPYDRIAYLPADKIIFAASTESHFRLASLSVQDTGVISYGTEWQLGSPVLSLTAERKGENLNIFAVQPQQIQQFSLPASECRPPARGLPHEIFRKPTVKPADEVKKPLKTEVSERFEPEVSGTSEAVADEKALAVIASRLDRGFQQINESISAQAKILAEERDDRVRTSAKLQVALEGLSLQLQSTLQAQFAALQMQIDQSIDESTEKIIRSMGAQEDMRRPVAAAFRSGLEESLIPALETSIQRAFISVNDTLERGLESCLKVPVAEALAKLKSRVDAAPDSETQADGHRLDNTKDVITKLIETENYEQAFTEVRVAYSAALQAQNLAIMMWLLGQTEPSEVLDKLSQVVLISVIQQLGVDLKNEVDVKFEWLQEAVLHVERDDTNIAAHIPQVVEAVEQSLKDAVDGGYTDIHVKSAKKLSMLLRSLLK